MTEDATGRLDRTFRLVKNRFRGAPTTDLSDRALRRLRSDIDAAIEARSGELTARQVAGEIRELYSRLDDLGRAKFFALLAESYGVDRRAVDAAIDRRRGALTDADDPERALADAESGLREALTAPRTSLFTRFNGQEGGVKFLVDLRADLLELARSDSRLHAVDADLRELLESWFDVGLLELRQISWSTSAALLEKLIEYEAVHAIESWTDLKNRLDSDRRCYAFFHPGMPEEPLIFVEVALTRGVADSVDRLLDESAPIEDPDRADTAIFYSISNCQAGLAGVNLGDSLIKRVVNDLRRELPNLEQFATLSPIPGYRAWLEERLETDADELFTESEAAALCAVIEGAGPAAVTKRLLKDAQWFEEPGRAAALRAPLMRLCATYLLQEKRGLGAHDRVANFHLTNGARIERLNWLANTAAVGIARSAGVMVNYRYDPDDIDRNHERYVTTGEIAASNPMRRSADR